MNETKQEGTEQLQQVNQDQEQEAVHAEFVTIEVIKKRAKDIDCIHIVLIGQTLLSDEPDFIETLKFFSGETNEERIDSLYESLSTEPMSKMHIIVDGQIANLIEEDDIFISLSQILHSSVEDMQDTIIRFKDIKDTIDAKQPLSQIQIINLSRGL